MKVAVPVAVVQASERLVEDRGDEARGEGSTFARLGELEEVAFHALEDEVQLARGREEEGVVERDDVGVHRDLAERLQGMQRVSAVEGGRAAREGGEGTHLELLELEALVPPAVKGLLHALDGDELLALVLGPARGARELRARRQVERRVPVGEPDGPERAVADLLEHRPVSRSERRRELARVEATAGGGAIGRVRRGRVRVGRSRGRGGRRRRCRHDDVYSRWGCDAGRDGRRASARRGRRQRRGRRVGAGRSEVPSAACADRARRRLRELVRRVGAGREDRVGRGRQGVVGRGGGGREGRRSSRQGWRHALGVQLTAACRCTPGRAVDVAVSEAVQGRAIELVPDSRAARAASGGGGGG